MDNTIDATYNQDAFDPSRASSGEKRRPAQRSIERERSIWNKKKQNSLVMAARMGAIGRMKRCGRMSACAETLISDVCCICETRYIVQAYFCRDRICPVCSWRRSKKLAQKLKQIIALNEREKKSRYIFLTLTVENVPWSALADEIKTIMKSWDKFGKRIRRASIVTGWVRTFEVTRSVKFDNAHPHLHILMQVPPEYFDPDDPMWLAYKKDDLIKQWQECLCADYGPSIKVQAVRDNDYSMMRSILEVAKYIAKGDDISGLSDGDFRHYVDAIHGVRVWSSGGRMKIKDSEIEEFLHDGEMTHEEGTCGNCGGQLIEMREVWSQKLGVYVVKTEIDFDKIKYFKQAGLTNHSGNHTINLTIETNGGNVYVGGSLCRDNQKFSEN